MIEGKWIVIANADTYLVPKINFFEFSQGQIIVSDCEKTIQTNDYHVNKNEIFVNNNYFGHFEFIDKNRFTLYKSDEVDSDKKLELDFVQLKETKTDLNEDEVKVLTFESIEFNIVIAFNVELQKPALLEILKEKASKMMLLKRIGSTLFICNYEAGELESIFLIKEVNQQFIEIYGYSRIALYSMKIYKR